MILSLHHRLKLLLYGPL